jgi:hypothetical protein
VAIGTARHKTDKNQRPIYTFLRKVPGPSEHESPDHESPAETPRPGNSPVAATTRPILHEYNHVVIFDKFFNPVVDPVWTTTASKTVTPQCGYGVNAKNYGVSLECD